MKYELNNILYTPLDVPDKPIYDKILLKEWLSEHYDKLAAYKNILINHKTYVAESAINTYPWNITVAYLKFFKETDPGWLGNFDKLFPELSSYFYKSFGLELEDVGAIILLPIKKNHVGLGFWHNDPDWYGLRHYLCFDNLEANKLLLKKTRIKNDVRPDFEMPIDEVKFLSDETYECKILSQEQSFYLNNVNSVHSTFTEIPNVDRIAVLIAGWRPGRKDSYVKKIENLIINSAIKYQDYAIFYDDEK